MLVLPSKALVIPLPVEVGVPPNAIPVSFLGVGVGAGVGVGVAAGV